MYTSIRQTHIFDVNFFRWAARVSGVVLLVAWLALVLAEALKTRFDALAIESVYQGVALAVVFAGYAIGWRKEFLGGVIAIVGTVAFFAVQLTTIGTPPELAAVWFAAPGVLYLLASHEEKVSRRAA